MGNDFFPPFLSVKKEGFASLAKEEVRRFGKAIYALVENNSLKENFKKHFLKGGMKRG